MIRKKPLKKVSTSQREKNRRYARVRAFFLDSHRYCEIGHEGCTTGSTMIHHTKGRLGTLLTDTRFFKAACMNCHTYAEEHPLAAKELGYSNNRLSLDD